jgi:hypothetical protein
MKTKTIYTIREMLKQWNKEACNDFEEYDKKLKEKYGEGIYYYVCTQTETETWRYKINNFNDSQDALDDFENHVWD